MNRVKKIYFLAAFVIIIGCYTLNKKYTTLNNDLTTNITKTYTVVGKVNPYSSNINLLSYNILNNYVT